MRNFLVVCLLGLTLASDSSDIDEARRSGSQLARRVHTFADKVEGLADTMRSEAAAFMAEEAAPQDLRDMYASRAKNLKKMRKKLALIAEPFGLLQFTAPLLVGIVRSSVDGRLPTSDETFDTVRTALTDVVFREERHRGAAEDNQAEDKIWNGEQAMGLLDEWLEVANLYLAEETTGESASIGGKLKHTFDRIDQIHNIQKWGAVIEAVRDSVRNHILDGIQKDEDAYWSEYDYSNVDTFWQNAKDPERFIHQRQRVEMLMPNKHSLAGWTAPGETPLLSGSVRDMTASVQALVGTVAASYVNVERETRRVSLSVRIGHNSSIYGPGLRPPEFPDPDLVATPAQRYEFLANVVDRQLEMLTLDGYCLSAAALETLMGEVDRMTQVDAVSRCTGEERES